VEEKSSRPWRTLLTGLPSPTSTLLSLATFLLNSLLVLAATDLIYRGKTFYPSHDLSFARMGYVSPTEASLLVREPDSSKLPIFVSYKLADTPASYETPAWQSAGTITTLGNDTDFTAPVTFPIPSHADRTYQWLTSNNHTGFFTVPPKPGNTGKHGSFTFLTSSCIKPRFPYNPLHHPLAIPGFRHMKEVIDMIPGGPQFMLFLGDFIYVDVPKRFGVTVEDYRREYRQVYSSPDWPLVGQNLSWIHVIDDHEIANDWDGNTTGVYTAAADPWHNYQTSVNPPKAHQAGKFNTLRADATYFEFTQGPATFFMMDTRTYRDSSSDLPSNSTTKTMMGPEQLADLLAFLAKPEPKGVKWKIVVSSIPFTKNWRVNSQDTWAGYLHERQIILEAMWDVGLRGGVGVVVLSGDRHEFAATAFPPPAGGRWPISATVNEFSTSPLSQFYLPTPTYRQTDEEDVMVK
jgi:alkaline phosphatase D